MLSNAEQVFYGKNGYSTVSKALDALIASTSLWGRSGTILSPINTNDSIRLHDGTLTIGDATPSSFIDIYLKRDSRDIFNLFQSEYIENLYKNGSDTFSYIYDFSGATKFFEIGSNSKTLMKFYQLGDVELPTGNKFLVEEIRALNIGGLSLFNSSGSGIHIDHTNGNTGFKNVNPLAIIDANPTTIDTGSFSRPQPILTTAQRNALASMPEGACVWDTDEKTLRRFDGSNWIAQTPNDVVNIHNLSDFVDQVEVINTLTGTYSTTSTAVNGVGGSLFLTEFKAGDFIYDTSSGEHRKIASISSNIFMFLTSAFTIDVSAGELVKNYIKEIRLATNTLYTGGRVTQIVVPDDNQLIYYPASRTDGIQFVFLGAYPIKFISSGDIRDCQIIYQSAIKGTIFTSSAIVNVLRIQNTTLVPYADAKLFDFTAGGTAFILLNTLTTQSAGGHFDLGNITSCLLSMRDIVITSFKEGLTITNGIDTSINTVQIFGGRNLTTNQLEFNGTGQGKVNIFDYRATMSTNEKMFNFDPATAFVGGVTCIVSESNDKTRDFAVGSLDSDSPGFNFGNTLNKNIKNSSVSGEIELKGNTTETEIPAQNAWIVINSGATLWVDISLRKLSLDTSNGKVTLNSLEDVRLSIDPNIDLRPATSTKKLKSRAFHTEKEDFDVTFDNTTNTITDTPSAVSTDGIISFLNNLGTLPVELRKDAIYYEVNRVGVDFQASYTPGGSAIVFTDDGSLSNTYSIATEHGAIAKASISSLATAQIVPRAFVDTETDDDVLYYVANETDSVNIVVENGYERFI